MKAYTWDEVGCEVAGWPMADPPDGLADKDILLLADARITVECGGATMGTVNHQFRNEDGVMILEGQFGREKETRLYICLEDDAKAKALAEKELDAYLEE